MEWFMFTENSWKVHVALKKDHHWLNEYVRMSLQDMFSMLMEVALSYVKPL